MSKFLVNFDKMNESSEKMASGGSGLKYLSQSKIPANGEITIRILPHGPSLEGLYFLKVYSVWINKHNYVSPRTFGRPCPILDFIEEAEKTGSDDIKAMIAQMRKKGGIKEEYFMNILKIDHIYEGRKLVESVVDGDTTRIFKCSWSVMKQINLICSHRRYQNDVPLGIFDIEKGYNIDIAKEVGERTSYRCDADPTPMAMDPKFYEEVPDLVEVVENRIYSDEYLEGVVAHYFLEDEKPSDDLKWIHREEGDPYKAKQQEEEVIEEKPAPKTAAATKTVSKSITKSVPNSDTKKGSLLDRARNRN